MRTDRLTVLLYPDSSLFGATLTSFKTADGQERLFVSGKAALDGSKAVSPLFSASCRLPRLRFQALQIESIHARGSGTCLKRGDSRCARASSGGPRPGPGRPPACDCRISTTSSSKRQHVDSLGPEGSLTRGGQTPPRAAALHQTEMAQLVSGGARADVAARPRQIRGGVPICWPTFGPFVLPFSR